jgi:hypothetical protein
MSGIKVISVTGSSYPNAVELPVSKARPGSKAVGRPGGSGGAAGGKKKSHVPPVSAAQKKLDQEATAANRKKLVITATGRRQWVSAA